MSDKKKGFVIDTGKPMPALVVGKEIDYGSVDSIWTDIAESKNTEIIVTEKPLEESSDMSKRVSAINALLPFKSFTSEPMIKCMAQMQQDLNAEAGSVPQLSVQLAFKLVMIYDRYIREGKK